jgi:amino-acid N-acetyltransferase
MRASEPKSSDSGRRDDFSIGPATPEETDAVKALLVECGLPTRDLSNPLENFLVLRRDKIVIGCVGLEIYGDACILRSLAVAPTERKRSFGIELVKRALAAAESARAPDVWLLTQTAAGFFEFLRFRPTDRGLAPPRILASSQFHGVCPSTAVCMRRTLG